MKLYLDDERPTPEGWHRVYTVAQAIEALETRTVEYLSVDNDLGSLDPKTEGFNLINWLEETVYYDSTFPVPIITIHSSNAARVQDMERAINSINRIKAKYESGMQ